MESGTAEGPAALGRSGDGRTSSSTPNIPEEQVMGPPGRDASTSSLMAGRFANVPSYGAGPLLKKQIHMVSCNDELDLELAEGGGLVSRALRCRRTPDILIASSKGLQEAETPPLLLPTLFPSYSYSSLLTSTCVGAVPANQLTMEFAADGVLQEAQHRKANNASATSTQRGVTSAAAAYIGTPWSGAVHGSSAQAVFLNPGEPERDKAQRRIPKRGLCDRKGHEACQCFLKPPHLKPDSPRALVVAEPQLVKTDPTKRAAVMASGTLSLLAIESHRSTWQLQTRIASSTHLCFRRDYFESLRQIGERASLGMGDAKYHVSACVGTVLLALEVNGVQAEMILQRLFCMPIMACNLTTAAAPDELYDFHISKGAMSIADSESQLNGLARRRKSHLH